MNKLLLSASLLMLAGCTVGPDYQAPADPPQKGYDLADLPAQERAGVAGPTLISGPVPADWWKLLGNPALDRTEDQALADNATLSAAKATLRQAEQVVIEAKAAWYPQADLSAGVQRNGSGGFTAAGGGTSSDFFSIGPSVSYMADLFGATARAVEQSQAQADSQRWQVEAARLTLVGGVATEALAIASARLQIATAEEILASDRKNLTMVQRQFEVGKAARSDVLTAQSQLVGDQTQIASLRQQLSVARHALAVLMSQTPADWSPPDFAIDDFALPDNLPVTVPSELVHKRPDIAAAEAQLHAASAAIGVAAAAQYPQITLTAAVTQQSEIVGTIFNPSNNLWNVGASLSQPLFHGGALEAQRQAAVEAYQAQLDTYRQTVIAAFGQVADSLRALEHDAELLADAQTALDISASSLALQRSSYQVGKTSLLQLLTAERAFAQAKQSLATAKAQKLTDVVQFYVSLGVTQ
jgi:NodT family efflux transporter outer membrane factor (OMF) lipoprotein